MGSHFLLQGIFPTQGSNPCLLHCRQILYHLSYQGSLPNCSQKLCNYTHTHTHTYMCAYILLNFSWLQSGRTGNLWLMHPSGLLGASEEKHLWFHFMAPLVLSGEVTRAGEADGRANQQVFPGDFLSGPVAKTPHS